MITMLMSTEASSREALIVLRGETAHFFSQYDCGVKIGMSSSRRSADGLQHAKIMLGAQPLCVCVCARARVLGNIPCGIESKYVHKHTFNQSVVS
jgi:hypothetical protein